MAEGNVKRLLRDRRAFEAEQIGIGEQNNQRGGGAHQQRVDKHADKSHHALLHRVRHLRGGVRMRGGAHARFIGKEPARHAEADGFAHRDAGQAAAQRRRVESRYHNLTHHRHDVRGKTAPKSPARKSCKPAP